MYGSGSRRLQTQLLDMLHRSWKAGLKTPIIPDDHAFSLKLAPSTVHGQGVFLSNGHVSEPGMLLCLYPGTLYLNTDIMFWVSIRNSFILRRIDGILVDGKDSGLSKRTFISCAERDAEMLKLAKPDTSWIGSQSDARKQGHLNCGQYINYSNNGLANVAYMECDFQAAEFPPEFSPYLPYTWANMESAVAMQDTVHIVALVSTSEIKKGDELFSTYITLVR
eukprot:ANDGO_04937.mRNA.1 hypothetical protein